MAQTHIAKGAAASKTSETTLTIPDVSMIGGDVLVVTVAWDITISGNPTSIKFGNNDLGAMIKGETMNGKWRMRTYAELINNTRTKDLVATWPTANSPRLMCASSLHQAGKTLYNDSNENLASTVSTTGPNEEVKHISTLTIAHHVTNGPIGDNIGSSSTGGTLGQRIGTSGDADNTNITMQEVFEVIEAGTVASGSFGIGDHYQIKTVGTTDFTAVGAANNNIGTQFIATGVGTGTGDAYELEEARSRLTGLTNRDHMATIVFFQPKQTFTIKEMVQYHRNVNQNPDWVQILVKDEDDRGFWLRIDPDHFDDWSDANIAEYVSKIASIWVTNHIDNNLVYEADTARDIRMATFINDQIIL